MTTKNAPRAAAPGRQRAGGASPHAEGDDQGMLLEERRREIRALIEEKGRVTTDQLATRFNTSLVTIRGDLNALAETGRIVRTHGGALAHRDGEEVPIEIKQSLRHAEKVRIATAAAAMIQEGDTILL